MTTTHEHQTTGTTSPSFLRRNALVVTVLAILLAAAVGTGLSWSSRHSTLEAQKTTIGELDRTMLTVEGRNANAADKHVLNAIGVSRSRLSGDASTIKALLETSFTWDSGRTYTAARESLKSRFHLSEDDPWLTSFMPPARFNQDRDGKRYDYIDSVGLNSTLGDSLDIEVLKVRGTKYIYVVLADITVSVDGVTAKPSQSPDTATAQRRMLLQVTVDADGSLSELSGIPASGTTRQSR